MGRIVVLLLSFGLSCLLVTGLLDLTEGILPDAPGASAAQSTADSAGTGLQEGDETLVLPAQVPGTSLIAERLVCYEGPFMEDGSDGPVVNTAALVIRNAGHSAIRAASVTLERAGERYVFDLTYLLPGMSVMVQEASAVPYFRDGITAITGWAQTMEESPGALSGLELVPLDMGSLSVTNRTGEMLENILLLHKNYLPDGTFVGGITYETPIAALAPGQTQIIFPEHYAQGYSKIFCWLQK